MYQLRDYIEQWHSASASAKNLLKSQLWEAVRKIGDSCLTHLKIGDHLIPNKYEELVSKLVEILLIKRLDDKAAQAYIYKSCRHHGFKILKKAKRKRKIIQQIKDQTAFCCFTPITAGDDRKKKQIIEALLVSPNKWDHSRDHRYTAALKLEIKFIAQLDALAPIEINEYKLRKEAEIERRINAELARKPLDKDGQQRTRTQARDQGYQDYSRAIKAIKTIALQHLEEEDE